MQPYSKEEQFQGVKGWWNSDKILKWDNLYDNYNVHAMRYLNSRCDVILERLDEFNIPNGAKVLELGYGAGQIASELVHRGFDVTGVEISEKLCEVAKNRCKRNNPNGTFDLRVGNIEADLGFENGYFDVVIQMGCLQYLHNPNNCLKEAYRVLRPGGYFLVGQRNAYCMSYLTSMRSNVRNLIYFLFREKFEIESCYRSLLCDSKLGKYFKKYEDTKIFNSNFMSKGHVSLHYKMHKNIYTDSILTSQVKNNGFKVLKKSGAYFPFSENKLFWNFNLKYDYYLSRLQKLRFFHFLYKFSRTVIIVTKKYS